MIRRALALVRWLNIQSKKSLGVTLWPFAAAAFGAALLALWLGEHNAHVRQAYELERLKKQTAASLSGLRAQAAAALREANQQRAQAIRELESRQKKYEQEAGELRERIAAIQKEDAAKLEQVATLPASELVTSVATRLGLPPQHSAPPGVQKATGAGDLASASRPSAEGQALATTSLELDEAALRKVDTAFIELDSCRERQSLLDRQIANASNQLATTAATLSQQAASIGKLNQALQAKDQILAQSEAQHRAELKAVRGTLLGRLGHWLEHVAIGVVIGALIA